MLTILIIWLINLTIALALGSMVHALLFKNGQSLPEYLLFNGLFAYMLLIWVILYFNGFGLYWQIISFILSIIYLILRPKYVKILWQAFKDLSHRYKIVFYVTVLVVLILSSAPSSLPDNESYYIQTIKWANEQGLVKGLMNIHPFLGQFSGWHILQTGFNLHYHSFTFNDLNGLFFLIFVFYWLHRYQKDWACKKYWLGLLPVVSVLFVFFSDSPSPDLPVVLLSLMVFDLFIRNYQQLNRYQFIEMLLLSGFSFLIKPTAVINILLVLLLWWRHRKQLNHISLKIILFGWLLAGLWMSKNYRITGYLFYPFDFFGKELKPAWQYPSALLQYMTQLGKQDSMALSANSHLFTGFWQWVRQSGIHQIINPLMVILLILFPIVFSFKKRKVNLSNSYRLLYLLGLVYFLSILFISPNFRFFLALLIFLALFIKSVLIQPKFYQYFNTLGWGLFLAVGVYWAVHQHWHLKNLWFPQPVSGLNARYDAKKEGNFLYYYPYDKKLFWQTGDAPLPAVHHNQIEYFKKHFGIVPQKNVEKHYFFNKSINN